MQRPAKNPYLKHPAKLFSLLLVMTAALMAQTRPAYAVEPQAPEVRQAKASESASGPAEQTNPHEQKNQKILLASLIGAAIVTIPAMSMIYLGLQNSGLAQGALPVVAGELLVFLGTPALMSAAAYIVAPGPDTLISGLMTNILIIGAMGGAVSAFAVGLISARSMDSSSALLVALGAGAVGTTVTTLVSNALLRNAVIWLQNKNAE